MLNKKIPGQTLDEYTDRQTDRQAYIDWENDSEYISIIKNGAISSSSNLTSNLNYLVIHLV